MSISSRFAVSVHIATAISLKDGRPVASETIANSVQTNPSLVRKLLAAMSKAGITSARMGTGGGAVLARPAEAIKLDEIYRAVEDQALFSVHSSAPNRECMVGRNILPVLTPSLSRAEAALQRELSTISLADVVNDVRARAAIHGGQILP